MNPLLNTDSYKYSHGAQYPPYTKGMFSYLEARQNNAKYAVAKHMAGTLFFGLQYLLQEELSVPITQEDVKEAKTIVEQHGLPFNTEGFMYIVESYDGKYPVKIKAVEEGTVVPFNNVLVTIESDEPEVFWVVSFLETQLVRAVWYPTTVASISKLVRSIIYRQLLRTCDCPDDIIWSRLHDFGARGVSSRESAGIGGMAHLVNFTGTDTVEALAFARDIYDAKPVAGYSIPAAEHSTITAWGRNREVSAYSNMIEQFSINSGKTAKCPFIAVVSDSYDIFNAVENLWGRELRANVQNCGSTIVIRPDSGDPTMVVPRILEILDGKFGHATNKKHYKVLKNVRIIQGDGMNPDSISNVLDKVVDMGFSAENIAFGMGGALLQGVNRDTFSIAMKCSSVLHADHFGDEWIDVYKDPATSKWKASKRGRLVLVNVNGVFMTMTEEEAMRCDYRNELELVYDFGKIVKRRSFEGIRAKANSTVTI